MSVEQPAPVEVVATIERRRVAAGTKNDRCALVADIGGRPLVLRRRGAPAFSEDADLAALVGTPVRLRGMPLTTVFLVDDVSPL